ncbi:DUF6528 family protein [Stieleria tagensis]|uniref:DUF6528 family protein n=1 Tax=Stieleria tagensis TaxID=2956795 RepID=UPI00209B4E36|nr:DUF6528 family protein [Stieleria tagensis]
MTWTRTRTCFAACIIALALTPADAMADPHDLICCGAEQVFVTTLERPQEKKWVWQATQSPSIPSEFHKRFRTTDDCKPYEDELLLITSSSGGVALIDRSTKESQFFAVSKNAHSACLLPGRQLAVASSTGGDQVQFFNRDDNQKPAAVVQAIPLLGAHGTVWDAKRQCLWALGEKELLALVADTKSAAQERWTVRSRTPLPSNGGHDLSPNRDGKQLFVTTDTQVLKFDCDTLAFAVADGFGDQAKVKSVDRNVASDRIVFHQATAENWWSDTIRFTDGKKLKLADERLYKVRWDTPLRSPESDSRQ